MNRYPNGMLDWVKANYTKFPIDELVKQCNSTFGTNMTETAMKSLKTRYKLTGSPRKRTFIKYQKDVVEFIVENHKEKSYQQMIDLLKNKFGVDMTKSQIKSFYGNHHLNSGRTGRFEKGQAPFTKGKKQTEFMSKEAIERSSLTRFKKGQKPLNFCEIGTTVKTTDGYWKTKVANPNVWQLTHRLLWEQEKGEIPEKMMIMFKDGNKDNIQIDNLMMVTMEESAIMTARQLRFENPQSTEAGLNIAKLKIAAKKKGKKINGTKNE